MTKSYKSKTWNISIIFRNMDVKNRKEFGKKENSIELQKPNIEAEVYNKNKKYD